MKKIPYALILLIVYIVMTFLGARVAMDGGIVMQLSNVLIFVGPMVLAVLMLIGLKKPMAGIASIVCLLVGIAWVCVSCVRISDLMDTISAANADSNGGPHLLAPLPVIISGAITALLYLAITGKLQEDQVSGAYSALAVLGILLSLIVTFALKEYTGLGAFLTVIPSLVHLSTLKNLPAAFLHPESCKKLHIKHIIVLVVLTVIVALEDKLFPLLMSL